MSKMYNMSGKLNQAFERAIYLTEDFKSDEVCTVHMGLSILMDRSCCLPKLYLETGYEFACENIVYEILGNDEIFEYGKIEKAITGAIKKIRSYIEKDSGGDIADTH